MSMDELTRLSYDIAEFMEELDPYDFRDNLDTTETVYDGIERLAEEIRFDLESGDYDRLIDSLSLFDDDDICPDLIDRFHGIMGELNRLKKRNSKLISKNLFKIKRRKICN